MKILHKCHSKYMDQGEGLPHDSILSVTCFAFAVNQITKRTWQLGTYLVLYLVDFVIFIFVKNITLSNRLIQIADNELEEKMNEIFFRKLQ